MDHNMVLSVWKHVEIHLGISLYSYPSH